jgi:hypothetical protein
MSKILQNAIKAVESGEITYLVSTHRHDFKQYQFKSGGVYHVDGGKDYIKRGSGGDFGEGKVEDWNLTEKDSFKKCCTSLLWGSRGKDGKQPLKYAPFAELELDHLKAILEYSSKLAVGLSDLQVKVINYWIEQKSN